MKKTDELCEKIENMLLPEFGESMVDVSLSGIRDNIHIVIMSRFFDNMPEWEKQENVRVILNDNLEDEEKKGISLIVPVSPDELK